ncbi:hypothetical protein [Lysinibacillus capsici]|uniref:hypothetical protein n=1 Tax=Lysinibacillus capsici TaxID=2115968 RepID=UPI001CD99FCF|nr:hypothetical protein [Lysinibacillus capsici]
MNLYELVTDFNTYISKVPNGCLYIANALRNNDLASALQSIRDFSEGALWLVDATELLNNNNIIYDLRINEIQYFLEIINDNLEKKNYLKVADIFEQEIFLFFNGQKLIRNFDS